MGRSREIFDFGIFVFVVFLIIQVVSYTIPEMSIRDSTLFKRSSGSLSGETVSGETVYFVLGFYHKGDPYLLAAASRPRVILSSACPVAAKLNRLSGA